VICVHRMQVQIQSLCGHPKTLASVQNRWHQLHHPADVGVGFAPSGGFVISSC